MRRGSLATGPLRHGGTLTDEQERFFRAGGYLPVGPVSTRRQIHTLKTELARLVGDEIQFGGIPDDHLMRSAEGHVRVALHLCHTSEVFREHALEPRTAAMVGHLFGEEAGVLTSMVFNKPARVGEALTLHQDAPYYPYLGEKDLITVWTALDDVDRGNGCLEYIPGSHRSLVPHRQTGQQQAMDIDPVAFDASGAVPVALRAGEAVLHHSLTVHRSAANVSGRPRMGLATLFTRATVRVAPEDFPHALLAPAPMRSRSRWHVRP